MRASATLSFLTRAESDRIEPLLSTVMRGLDPRIHLLAKRMDCRVKPGNDNRFNISGNRCRLMSPSILSAARPHDGRHQVAPARAPRPTPGEQWRRAQALPTCPRGKTD